MLKNPVLTPLAKQQNATYQVIIDHSDELIAAVDNDYRFICFNQAFQQEIKKVFGKHIVIGMSLKEALADLPEELHNALAIWRKALQGEDHVAEMEFGDKQLERNTYQIRTYALRNTQDQIIGASQVAQNITLLKKAERNVIALNETLAERVEEQTQQLREQMQLTKTITDNTASALFMMDAKGHPTFMNPAAERITGYALEEIKHRPLHYAIHYKYPDGRPYPMEECPLDNSSAKLRPLQNQAEVFVDKKGRLFPVVWSIAPLEKSGQTLGAVIEFRDVTLEKKAEAERLAALEMAKEQERQRAQQAIEYRQKQEEFIDTICHEIRNPLNGVYGGVSLIKDNLKTLDDLFRAEGSKLSSILAGKFFQTLKEAKENLKIIQQCTEQQKSIVDDVLDLSKLEQNKIELNFILFNVKEQVQLVVQMFTPQITEKNLAVNVKVKDTWINADAHRFTQIMTNLISNAVKFTHEGTIEIEVLVNQINEMNVELIISVTDTGIGIDPEEVAKLFDRFTPANRRTASEYGGSGLGLAITKKLVEAMGGTIRVSSKKWHGTRFELTLQGRSLSLEEQQQIEDQSHTVKLLETSSKSSPQVMSGSKRILVVEDNSVNQKVLINVLNKQGHLCELAKNGAEALEKYEQFSFDCIFMDIEMPVMNGLDATRQIRLKEQTLNRHVPIIGLSGNARKEQVNIAFESGMDAYLTKPFHAQEVYQKIKEWCFAPVEHTASKKLHLSEEKHQQTSASSFKLPTSPSVLMAKAVHKPPLLEACISTFQAAACELLAQEFPFEYTCEQNRLCITLSTTPPAITPYMNQCILNDLKQKIEKTLTVLSIQNISLSNNHLIITTENNVSALNVQNCLSKANLFSRKNEPVINNVNAVMTEKPNLLSYPGVLFPSSSLNPSNSETLTQGCENFSELKK